MAAIRYVSDAQMFHSSVYEMNDKFEFVVSSFTVQIFFFFLRCLTVHAIKNTARTGPTMAPETAPILLLTAHDGEEAGANAGVREYG